MSSKLFTDGEPLIGLYTITGLNDWTQWVSFSNILANKVKYAGGFVYMFIFGLCIVNVTT